MGPLEPPHLATLASAMMLLGILTEFAFFEVKITRCCLSAKAGYSVKPCIVEESHILYSGTYLL